MITDTQILSFYFNGSAPIPKDPLRISSITAAEFLLIQTENPTRANYYPILPALAGHRPQSIGVPFKFDSKKHAAAGKHRTDQIILTFGPSGSYVEYGSLAITQLINGHHGELFAMCISHLAKPRQKILKEKFRFLLGLNVECVSLNAKIAEIGMDLLCAFLAEHTAKKRFRNTLNDILILATAIQYSTSLHTEDDLLRRFTMAATGGRHSSSPCGMVIDFSMSESRAGRPMRESRGYINRGWQVLERKRRW